MNILELFKGANVLVTGGMGFIGSNLVRRLVSYGSRVRIVDAALPETGANPYNTVDLTEKVELQIADLRDADVIFKMISEQDYLFNLAGLISHIESMQFPHIDLEVNASVQLSIVEACRKYNPRIKIVYAGTRQVYGRSQYLPVDEKHLIVPVDYNGVTKRAGEMYHLVAQRVYGLHAASLRLTNTYGPGMHCRDGRLNFIGDWVRRLFENQPVEIYGTGEQIRDLNYVEDVVDAFLLLAAHPAASGQIYNLGSPQPIRLIDLARMMIDINQAGSFTLRSFPQERLRIDIGDYQGDYSKIQTQFGWQPKVSLQEGLRHTFEYYRQHKEHYW